MYINHDPVMTLNYLSGHQNITRTDFSFGGRPSFQSSHTVMFLVTSVLSFFSDPKYFIK